MHTTLTQECPIGAGIQLLYQTSVTAVLLLFLLLYIGKRAPERYTTRIIATQSLRKYHYRSHTSTQRPLLLLQS